MTTPFEIVNAQRAVQADRERVAENSPRVAYETVEYKTTGVGQRVVPGALRFQTLFLEPPAVVSGMVITKLPKSGWLYPEVTAGVYKWLTNAKGYITGAYVYFNVRCQPEHEDDLNRDYRLSRVQKQAHLQAASDVQRAAADAGDALRVHKMAYEIAQLRAELMREERAEARGKANPGITHYLLFQGMAMKELPDNVLREFF